VQFNNRKKAVDNKVSSSGTTWTHTIPSAHETAIVYVRKGSVRIDGTQIEPQHTVFLSPDGDELTIEAVGNSAHEEVEILLLSGEPLLEPISTQGSMVMNTPQEVQMAYMDYQRGYMGLPWDHKLTDDEWKEHVRRNPSAY
jgi:redox-sensitive bicupin YhaK (pirin superfamily)